MTTPTTPAADAVSLPLVAEIWTCQGEIDCCRSDNLLGAFDTERGGSLDLAFVRLETATARESALVAERDALRAQVPQWLPIEQAPKDATFLILACNGRSFIGTWVEIPFQESRSVDGEYLDQKDADAYWMDLEDGEMVEPTHYMPMPPALSATAAEGV